MPALVTPAGPGLGAGWARLAERIRADLPVVEIDGIWVFRVLRRDGRDFGTAILSRVDGDRRRIYTASFVHTVKGKTRGQFEAAIAEVGSGPLEALEDLLGLVPARSSEDEPPMAVPTDTWFPPEPEPPPEDRPDAG